MATEFARLKYGHSYIVIGKENTLAATCRHRYVGFTLIELLVVLSILFILLYISLPSWQSWIANNRMTVITQQLMSAAQFARLAAISRGEATEFCGSRDLQMCDGHWDGGQIVKVVGVDTILQVRQPLPDGYHVVWKSNFGQNKHLRFNSEGYTLGQQGHFTVCPPQGLNQHAEKLVVLLTGRIRLSHAPDTIDCDQFNTGR